MEEMMKEFSNDFKNLQMKFDAFSSCILSLVDRVQTLESRIEVLEKNNEGKTYASVVTNSVCSKVDHSERLEKLEFNSSENERKDRSLHVQISHPALDPSSQNLDSHVQDFLRTKLNMSTREIDLNMTTLKSPRSHTVIVKCSDRKFKLFIYSARKKLRSENSSLCQELFIGDHLTSFNLAILKQVKSLKIERTQANKPSFETFYTFNGRVFVKISRSDSTELSIPIRNSSSISALISKLDSRE